MGGCRIERMAESNGRIWLIPFSSNSILKEKDCAPTLDYIRALFLSDSNKGSRANGKLPFLSLFLSIYILLQYKLHQKSLLIKKRQDNSSLFAILKWTHINEYLLECITVTL